MAADLRSYVREFAKGFTTCNPTFGLFLGICPTLASTTSVRNAIAMGIAATFVLVCSNVIISAIRKVVPNAVRIPCFIVVIAAFVTIVDMVMKGFFYEQSRALSIFIPLIVVNCIILGRAEAFAQKNTVFRSLLDGVGIGMGFTVTMIFIATIRETLGAGTFFDFPICLDSAGRTVYQPMSVLLQAPGGFLVLGLLMAMFKFISQHRRRAQAGRLASE